MSQLNGSSLPAIRIELNPRALFRYGIGLEDVRAAISAANANSPKGDIQQQGQSFQVFANDTATLANDYKTLIIAYRNNAAVRLQDVAQVYDGVQDVRNLGTFNGQARHPGADHQAARRQCHPGGGQYPRPIACAEEPRCRSASISASCSTPRPRSATPSMTWR